MYPLESSRHMILWRTGGCGGPSSGCKITTKYYEFVFIGHSMYRLTKSMKHKKGGGWKINYHVTQWNRYGPYLMILKVKDAYFS